MRGKTISISGIDGSGKTTCFNTILNFYKKKKKKVISMYDINPEETYYTVTDLIEYYNMLSNYDVIGCRFYLKSNLTKKLQEDIFYNVEFSDSSKIYKIIDSVIKDIKLWDEYVIKKLLNQGKIIVFDRCLYDEFAYRSLYNIDIDKVINLYENEIKNFPDMRILCKESLETIIERNKNRPDSKTKLFKTTLKLKELEKNFELLKEKFSLIELLANKSLNETEKEIISLLKNKENI